MLPESKMLTIEPSPEGKRIGWFVYEVRGTDIFPWPENPAEALKDLDSLRAYATDDKLLTTRESLQEGMSLLVQDLFGFSRGVVSRGSDEKLHVYSPNGGLAFYTDFVDDRPPQADGTPSPPHWVCIGSGNLAAIKKLELYGGSGRGKEEVPGDPGPGVQQELHQG